MEEIRLDPAMIVLRIRRRSDLDHVVVGTRSTKVIKYQNARAINPSLQCFSAFVFDLLALMLFSFFKLKALPLIPWNYRL